MAAGSKFLNAAQGMGNTLISAAAGKVSDKLANGGEKMEGGQGQGQGGGAGTGNMGKSSKVEQLSAQLSQKADEKQGGIKARAEGAGGKSFADNAKAAGLSLAKAGLNMGNMMSGAMNVAMDMAGAEMTGNTAGYSSAGVNAAKAAMDGGKAINNTAAAVGNAPGVNQLGGMAADKIKQGAAYAKGSMQIAARKFGDTGVGQTASKVSQAWNAPRGGTSNPDGSRNHGFTNLHKEDIASGSEIPHNPNANIMGFRKTPSGSAGITRLASEHNGVYTNDNGGGINETMSTGQLATAARSSGVHNLVQSSIAGGAAGQAANDILKSMDVSYTRTGNGNIRINYGRGYMKNAGFEKVTATNDGKSLYIQQSGASRPVSAFAGMSVESASNTIMQNMGYGAQNPQNNGPRPNGPQAN